jgi:hypothetical protein
MQDTNEVQRRELAIKRIKAKNSFKIHLFVYAVVNLMLIVLWAAGVASGWTNGVGVEPFGKNFFWPIFPILGWGVGVAINGYVAYHGDIYTEEQIQREMKRLPG